MKHMEMRGDFLSQRSVKQTEGQNPIGRKKAERRRKERQMLGLVKEKKKGKKKERWRKKTINEIH